MKKSTILLLVTAFLIGLGAAFYLSQEPEIELPQLAPPAPTEKAPTVAETPETPARLPVSPPPSETTDDEKKEEPLPSLETSDADMREGLTTILPQPKWLDMFIFDHLIRRFVLMVDSLPRPDLPYQHLPLYTLYSRFIPLEKNGAFTISSKNSRRYAPFIKLVETVDMEDAAQMYHRYYPLFQEAYRELGSPGASFNDRFIEVIDHLLGTPVVKSPIRLVQPHIRYQYADPALEALSSGQKLLIRMGRDNAEIIQGKLRELRPLIDNPDTGNGNAG